MSEHIVIIGAVALGPKAACRYKRLCPDGRVTMIDASTTISYGGCGIPYFVSGDVSAPEELQRTSFHMLRDEYFFEHAKGVRVLTGTEALSIDRNGRTVRIRDLASMEESELGYDKLVIATGSVPRRLGIEGEGLPGVYNVGNLGDAIAIRDAITKNGVGKAVIVGAGFIGLEMAEALADMWGIETTVVEIADRILPGMVSKHMAESAALHMKENEVGFHFGESVQRIEGDGKVERVVTDQRTIEADLCIISAGILPNSRLAAEAGLAISERGGILVDEYLRTSDPLIYSGGDCVHIRNQITGKPFFLPMGSMANRQGRVIGNNLAGEESTFDGAVGSFAVKLFEQAVSGAGLSIDTALREGFDAVNVHMVQLDRAHFYPEKGLMSFDLVVEKPTGRVLGIQGMSHMRDALVGRINAVAVILKDKPHVSDLSNMEFSYSPPFSSAMDVINSLGNVADNILAGRNRGMDPAEFQELWQSGNGDIHFLDCRASADATPFVERHPGRWHNIPQDEIPRRLAEIPKDKQVVLVCNTGARSYEAQVMLDNAGISDTLNVEGGMAAIKKLGTDI